MITKTTTFVEKLVILFMVILSLTLGFVSGIIYSNKEHRALETQFNHNTGDFQWTRK